MGVQTQELLQKPGLTMLGAIEEETSRTPWRTRLSQATAWVRLPKTDDDDDGVADQIAGEDWAAAGSPAGSGGDKAKDCAYKVITIIAMTSWMRLEDEVGDGDGDGNGDGDADGEEECTAARQQVEEERAAKLRRLVDS
ncbi:hypothetical protein H072_9892 [Dactylellina haptotyla CBS 200.50]|uniref:Uncharacterized protein n=1 Tax=Dactylellina haptotyla (strain CBS 200.50) TaxID=1284197 RepID=S8A0Q2_DACHA|nr:hypothetical protein H072_9892 [Dactylellina haptotyla CBS 200.50]